jgi:hypothetical protein
MCLPLLWRVLQMKRERKKEGAKVELQRKFEFVQRNDEKYVKLYDCLILIRKTQLFFIYNLYHKLKKIEKQKRE